MSGFSAINLPKLPAPAAVDLLDVETILSEMKAEALARDPSLADALALESEPAVKILEVAAYRELLIRQRINEAVRATMLAFATSSDLDHIGALFGVERLVVVTADPDAFPPVEAVLEDDERLRTRIQLSLEGFSTAGTYGGYRFFALSASALVRDVQILNPEPGLVRVFVLSEEGDGVPDADLLAGVDAALDDEDVRPLSDRVEVLPVDLVDFSIEATLTIDDGPDSSVVIAAAKAALLAFLETRRLVGRNVPRAGIIAALYQAGVQNIALASPAADVVVGDGQSARWTAVQLTDGGAGV
ncbi:baseplate assembly protein [Salipiger sp. IMCC34102]|uniref:baseplate assembly protein n=1 Tax=Salipiger sp. IMCC34102 TaxID=2510647 RepID=UPI00101B7818|nr:baseplate J/gp47 family protein [Salipiger sp. IMCC34102]RYH04129.1 baseplate assembly protein [Salipiger sp. IMCC34102]